MQVFRYVLVVLETAPYGPKVGHEIVGDKSYYSRESCAVDARLIAQALFIKSGVKYGFRCVPVDYEPPDLDAGERLKETT